MYFQGIPLPVEDIIDVDDVTASDIAWAVLIAIAVVVAAIVSRKILKRWLGTLDGMTQATVGLLTRTLSGLILLTGAVVALPLLGFSAQPLLIVLIFLAVLVFFAGQPLMASYAAGLILQARGPFTVGDIIEHESLIGAVLETNNRTTIIDSPKGERIAIPNVAMLASPIINWTTLGVRRTTVSVGVAYGTDLDLAVDVVTRAVQDLANVKSDPSPVVGVASFDESSVRIQVWCWHLPTYMDEFLARDEIIRSISRALAETGIVIAFPQRDVWLRTSPDDSTESP